MQILKSVVVNRESIAVEEKRDSLFNFDPNRISGEEWIMLGFSMKQSDAIRKYVLNGGKFRIKSDLKKMYCISEEKYVELEPYLLLPDHLVKKQFERFKPYVSKTITVNINDVDSIGFMQLKGIGPVLASRITKYREKLGGFYSIDQIKEVWGVNDSLFSSIAPHLVLLEATPFRFIHLNSDSFEVFSSHPYVRSKVAGLICNYRKQHNSFQSIDEVKLLPLVTEQNFIKLAPYLKAD